MFHEREMYDMMGIVFEGNRDLRRIYMSPDYRIVPAAARTSSCPTTPPTRPPPASTRSSDPETWDLARFRDAPAVTYPPASERDDAPAERVESGETMADQSRPR